MPEFVKGLELSRLFYEEAVGPALAAEFPSLRHAAARLHTGSEVLGYDTEMSADHEWGPRVNLFIAARRPIGSVDQFSDSTDILMSTGLRATLRKLYE